uniref:Chromosome 10 open reading frame 53 n=2 Tax=Rhinopithecus TaxID=542827 RepID=A0A2K6M7C6_RHIBE
MPKNAVVILRYGPYSAAGLPVEHHTFRLQGLQAVLARDGHEVILEKIEDWNVVELMVNEEVVFHCNIKDLEFGNKLTPSSDKRTISSSRLTFHQLSSPCGMKAFPLQYFPLLYCLDHMLISELEKRETQPY